MRIKSNITITSILFALMIPSVLFSQIQLEVEGDAWIRDALLLNVNGPVGGEAIWNPTGLDLRFYTAGEERLRINGDSDGGVTSIVKLFVLMHSLAIPRLLL